MEILNSIRARFNTYKELGEKAMAQLNDEQLLREAPAGQNSIVIILRHLHGNMLSRFTNFLSEDGEKPWRDRDSEFVHAAQSREALLQSWNAGWQCLYDAIDSISDAELDSTVTIRGEAMTALDALLRQLAHYSYHIGQIVTLCRQETADWHSLSIPPGQSRQYNAGMQHGASPARGI